MWEKYMRDCRHCPEGFGLRRPLFLDRGFWVVCDVYPLIEGHILIVTEEHISCMGALPEYMFIRYKQIFEWVQGFLQEEYGSSAAFEHGIVGQVVFHAHTHLLPFKDTIDKVVPEQDRLHPIPTIDKVREEYRKGNQYLYVATGESNWLVDASIGTPRFFRDRFARALNVPGRGDWQTARYNHKLLKGFDKDISVLKKRWETFRQKD